MNALARYDDGIAARIETTPQIETIRMECGEMNAKNKFARGAGDALMRLEVVFLCFIFVIFILNIRLIRKIEATGQTNTSARQTYGI